MEQTIYVKYSNERAEEFCIRTDIVTTGSGEKKVYKYALTESAKAHIRHIETAYHKLLAAYDGSGICFCPAETETLAGTTPDTGTVAEMPAGTAAETPDGDAAETPKGTALGACRSVSPFLAGASLQDLCEQMLAGGDAAGVDTVLKSYVRRVMESGGSRPFAVTPEFVRVFGEYTPEKAYESAVVTDIDMIFSNIFVEADADAEKDADDKADADGKADVVWRVIDYEWTFDFPIPKMFVVYRAFYFAYHQIFHGSGRSLEDMLSMAGITPGEAKGFRQMEEKFQEYLGRGSLPVRNMQRLMGTRIISVEELLKGQRTAEGGAGETGQRTGEGKRIPVRRILYHVDRNEYQDGSVVCSGWALAKTWDGRCLPVEICVKDENGEEIPAELHRRKRPDVAETLKLRNAADAEWGFDCVWLASRGDRWSIHFSLGSRESIYEG